MLVRLKRRIALLLLAVLALAQVNTALASCAMDRAAMTMAMTAPSDTTCEGCDSPLSTSDQVASACASHCVTSEQPAAFAQAIAVLSPSVSPVLLLPRRAFEVRSTGLDGPPSGAPPRRILLHSFLI